LLLFLAACAPGRNCELVQSAHRGRTEHILRDSIYLLDSVFVAQRADTVYYEKWRTVYRDRLLVDTFIVCDTLFKEKVVTVERVVKRYPFAWASLLLLGLCVLWNKGGLGWLLVLLKRFLK
jgi:hypothetical protein